MHSPLIRHQSLRHFSIKAFQRVASVRSQDPEAFVRFERQGEKSGRVTYKKFGRGSRTACLIERGSQVLMVAHVDTVLEPRKEAEIFADRLFHNAIDNRLGVYLGLAVLSAMGLNVDLLLTSGEENGASTAACFARGSNIGGCFPSIAVATMSSVINTSVRRWRWPSDWLVSP